MTRRQTQSSQWQRSLNERKLPLSNERQLSITNAVYTTSTLGANSVTHRRRKGFPTHAHYRTVFATNAILVPTTQVTDSSNKLLVSCCSSGDESALRRRLVCRRLPTLTVCKRSSLGCVCCPIIPLKTCDKAFRPSREATPGHKFVRLNCTFFYARKFGKIKLI